MVHGSKFLMDVSTVLGKFYLADAGYACRPGFLPPYRGTRYHLKEYGGRNYPTNPRELFNLRHSSLRVTMEKGIWGFEESIPYYWQQTISSLQDSSEVSTCLLHFA